MLKLATIIDNPGEPAVETRYRDPLILKELGYNGIVIYETTGFSGVSNPQNLNDSELRHWLTQRLEHIRETIHKARAADLQVYIFYDVLVLAKDVVIARGEELICRNRSQTLCPASETALRLTGDALAALIDRLPPIEGVVLRFGDTDAPRLPYLVGNDIYQPNCAHCSAKGRADRIVDLLRFYYELVVQRLNKRLIARAWNVRPEGMHDSIELCQRIAARLPGPPDDDRLILSFKWTQTDFWRYQQWNAASQVFADRPIMYELECQREFEGKGGVPNWQGDLWQNGCPEMHTEGTPAVGLREAAGRVNLAGLLTWVRGGGWGGPFVSNETWIDANVYAAPRLAQQPNADLTDILQGWITDRLGIEDPTIAKAIETILHHSSEAVLKGFYVGPIAQQRAGGWHPNADWIQDDLIDVDIAWQMIQKLHTDQLDSVIREKSEAAELAANDRATFKRVIQNSRNTKLEALMNSLIYTESLYIALRDLFTGLVSYRRFLQSPDAQLADICRRHIYTAQAGWNHHTQRCGSLPGGPTAFREKGFWELTQKILSDVMEDAQVGR